MKGFARLLPVELMETRGGGNWFNISELHPTIYPRVASTQRSETEILADIFFSLLLVHR